MRLLAPAILGLTLVVACSSQVPTADIPNAAAPPPACAFSIVALPADTLITEDEPLPAGSRVIVRPDEFDARATTVEDGVDGSPTVTLHLRAAAIDAFAKHTKDHIGDAIAIVLNGDVMTVPVIQEQIPDGEIRLTVGGVGAARFISRVAGCA
ncbi:MAG TPA: hypothetical protein VFM38_04310, partial [Candidatus Limnocylindrales bacterium]|nr:hypothetical protein [Candidatus Limnocylindrales bacterium]